jgi:hypothetical protein
MFLNFLKVKKIRNFWNICMQKMCFGLDLEYQVRPFVAFHRILINFNGLSFSSFEFISYVITYLQIIFFLVIVLHILFFLALYFILIFVYLIFFSYFQIKSPFFAQKQPSTMICIPVLLTYLGTQACTTYPAYWLRWILVNLFARAGLKPQSFIFMLPE